MQLRMKLIIALAAMLAAALPHASFTRTSSPSAPTQRTAAISPSAFGIDLYREILGERPGANVIVSPASVRFALGMTYAGARGATMRDMAKTLGREGKSLAEISGADSLLIAGTKAPAASVELSVANSLWARQGLRFNEDFLARNKRCYGAEIRSVDFASAEAPARINEWVARNTNNRITEIVDRVDESSILFLVNAVYFKGSWTRKFDRQATSEETFYAPAGEKKCPMMHQNGTYLYLKGDGFQAASIPYGDGKMSMYIFLPDLPAGLDDFHRKLSAESWDAWMKSFAERSGSIVLPRFKLEFKATLKSALTKMGMGIAFDGARADFGGMVKHTGANAYIDDVAHKTFVEVNEEGTEAAAATAVEMRLTAVMEPERPFEMICDHPFFFAIRDNETGLILFMGSITNPE